MNFDVSSLTQIIRKLWVDFSVVQLQGELDFNYYVQMNEPHNFVRLLLLNCFIKHGLISCHFPIDKGHRNKA